MIRKLTKFKYNKLQDVFEAFLTRDEMVYIKPSNIPYVQYHTKSGRTILFDTFEVNSVEWQKAFTEETQHKIELGGVTIK